MTFDVLLTQKNEKFFAHVRQWPEIVGVGDSEETALSTAREALKALLTGGRIVQLELDVESNEHPWQQFAGMFAQDVDWDAFQTSCN
ncbi:MAG TPA: type II toxin-antitoxin system HicB family antitoxin [Anaerolineae bacterium]|nr:type II toxin-antitoxin system HicB family antitoxin [Anaerolineae bacterium]HRV95665.1 type II toxin-antitoxin system HicB family antitoxin [Anaerolineae bacterium]